MALYKFRIIIIIIIIYRTELKVSLCA